MNPKEIIRTIKKYRSFVISTHMNADPDALCSELAMALFLKSLGKKVQIINHDAILKRYQFLPKSHQVKVYSKTAEVDFEAMIVVDCGDLSRIGDVQNLLTPKHAVINIDHHITNDRFGRVNLVKTGASSTAEVLFDLFKFANFRFTAEFALLIYLGIMTDTGSFRYENTTSHTHAIVGELLKFRIPVAELYQKLYEAIPLTDLKDFSRVINRFESLENGRVVFVSLYKKDVKKFSEDFDVRDSIFKYLRAIKGVEVLAIFTEISGNKTRINLRSTGKVDVAKLADHFDGGGHKRASGCMIEKPMAPARSELLKAIRKVLA